MIETSLLLESMEKIVLYSIGTCLCLLISALPLQAQSFQALQDSITEVKKSDPSAALSLISSAIGEYDLTYDEKGLLYFSEGKIHDRASDKEKAILSFYNALRFFRLARNNVKEHESLIFLAILFRESNHSQYAVEYYRDALNVPNIDSAKIRYALYNLSLVYLYDENYSDSQIILQELVDHYTSVSKTKWLLLCKSVLADSYGKSEKFQLSIDAYQEILTIIDTTSDYRNLKSKSLSSIGFYHFKLKNYDVAKEIMLEALALKEQQNLSNQTLLVSYMNLGELYMELSLPHEAEKYYHKAVQMDSSVNHEHLVEVLDWLCKIALAKDDKIAALDYKDHIIDLQKPLVAESKRLEILHEQYIAERAKYLHEKIILKDQLVIASNQKIVWIICASIIILFLVAYLLYQYGKIRTQNGLLPKLASKDKLLNFIVSRYRLDLIEESNELSKRSGSTQDST